MCVPAGVFAGAVPARALPAPLLSGPRRLRNTSKGNFLPVWSERGCLKCSRNLTYSKFCKGSSVIVGSAARAFLSCVAAFCQKKKASGRKSTPPVLRRLAIIFAKQAFLTSITDSDIATRTVKKPETSLESLLGCNPILTMTVPFSSFLRIVAATTSASLCFRLSAELRRVMLTNMAGVLAGSCSKCAKTDGGTSSGTSDPNVIEKTSTKLTSCGV
mmetsp:Transcript_45241/g.88846  ORF Transcript_45241/g.88846 Transcript_45241/m.88846 type:complete len:216 (-) Transcript_45241:247-894(-)